jgi:hypothetical protein
LKGLVCHPFENSETTFFKTTQAWRLGASGASGCLVSHSPLTDVEPLTFDPGPRTSAALNHLVE